ncbi:MAG: AraC family transcriptional regulator [Myxococcales bacterium]|nr:AraC family transcriptional regulator [Myxococcales bacterium]
MLARHELSAEQLAQPGLRIPMSVAHAFLDECIEQARDPALGIHIAGAVDPSLWGTHGYAMLVSPSLRHAFEWADAYHPLISDDTFLHLEVDGDRAYLRFGLHDGGRAHRVFTEVFLTISIDLGRKVIEQDWVPTEVRLVHSAPSDRSEHERVFGPHLRFGALENALVFPAELLDRANPNANVGLFRVFERDAQDVLAALPPRTSLCERVRHVLREDLAEGNSTAVHVAERLGMSVRTLHRLLANEGTSHGQLLDGLRQELALQLLDEPDRSIQEVADRLGFSRPGSFTRAFKRWTGVSPATYRRQRR